MAQGLRTCAALLHNLGSVPSTKMAGSNTILWPLWASGMQMVHTHACRQNHSHTQNE